MNILVSDKWLREWVKMKQNPQALAAAISLVGPSVEHIYSQGADLDKIVVGKILSVGKHPNADKLRVTVVDVGSKKLNIVCGGSNLAENQLVAVALIGSSVRWHGQGDLVKLEPATIRGVASEGMICGANEIGLSDRFPSTNEKEIVDLTPFGYKPGTPLAAALGLNDSVYDIEVTTNRPDALGIVGLAREAAAATGGEFLWKEQVLKVPKLKTKSLKVSIQAKKLCSRYEGALIKGITVKDSPLWMQERLAASGLRPINALVDISNYVMLELGQPMHAFDADKIKNHSIVVRTAKVGESIVALDGKQYELNEKMLVIADSHDPLAIAGVIGGAASKVTEETKNIILESASFDSTSIRQTARALNLRTDAVMRFEKQVPQGLTAPALARAVELVLSICGGELAAVEDVVAVKEKAPRLSIAVKTLNEKIGIAVSPAAAKKYLASLGFKVTATAGKISALVPYWRVGDVGIAEDLIEEVARLYGYHNLPALLPPNVSGEAPDPVFAVEARLRTALVGAGANDLMSIALVGVELLKQSGETETPTVRLANPLTTDMDSLRPSHRARLLDTVRSNEKSFSSGSAFEIGKVFTPAVDDTDLPEEILSLGLVVWGASDKGEAFFKAKGLLETAALALHAPLAFGRNIPKNNFWHPGRTASVHLGAAVIGTIGELAPDARKTAGVESPVALALVDMAELIKAAQPSAVYHEPSAYPPVLRDVAFVTDRKTEHEFVVAAIKAVDPLIVAVDLFDRYEGKGIEPGQKSLAYHLTYQSSNGTLTAEEVDVIHGLVAKMLEHKFGATIRV
jgi:phenylalanyl-tRNA synthetase beta chain